LPVRQNARPQTAAAFQKFFRARPDGAIHPITGPAFLGTVKKDALDFKILADQLIQIDISRNDVAPDCCGRASLDLERVAQLIKNLQGKEGDLALVIVPEIKVTIAANATTSHAFDQWNLDRGKFIRFAAVVPNKIVSARNIKMTDFHRRNDNIAANPFHMKQIGIGSEKIIRRKPDGALEYQPDDLTVEEPLEIRIGRKVLATTMRTPGHDEELAAGFLVSEGIVRRRDTIDRFSRPATARNRENIIVVEPGPGVKLKPGVMMRLGTISSSCGICGKESIAAIRQNFSPVPSTKIRIEIATLLSLPALLQKHQGEFARTGGIHAAGIFDVHGELKIVREDIGRHNAVDKAIGRAFLEGVLPLHRHLLVVSGRSSFEIMQKALAAGIPIVASVSAPSTLAVNFARENNQTLIGFLRPPSFNIYSHIERVDLS
jgi:FdhD protein